MDYLKAIKAAVEKNPDLTHDLVVNVFHDLLCDMMQEGAGPDTPCNCDAKVTVSSGPDIVYSVDQDGNCKLISPGHG